MVEPGAERLNATSPVGGWFDVDDPIDPITVTGSVPADLADTTLDYTISIPGYILEHGQVTPSGGTYTLDFDAVTLQKTFPNLDLYGRDERRAGLSDTVSIALLLAGEKGGATVYRANTVTLQGQRAYVGPEAADPPVDSAPGRRPALTALSASPAGDGQGAPLPAGARGPDVGRRIGRWLVN